MTAPHARTYRGLLAVGRGRLEAAGIETAALDAAVLLAHAAGLTRTALYARLPEDATPTAIRVYDMLLVARAGRMPVAYLLGEKEFGGLTFAVTPATLVPRPETELLVEWAVHWLAQHPNMYAAGPGVTGAISAIDVGTGSGAIAVSLAHRASGLTVAATDISATALRVAQANAVRHGVANRVAFVRGDLLAWLGRPVPLMLANLPYLTDAQADDTGIAAEPRTALAGGGADGFAEYHRLIPQAAQWLTPAGAFAFELDPAQVAVAHDSCRTAFPDAKITTHDDLAALPRFISVEKYD